ncbi:ATPase [Corynebacterium frankenforstense]
MDLFAQVAVAFGKNQIIDMDDVYRVLLTEALTGDEDAGGIIAFNYLSGEPITKLTEGRPLVVRGPDADLTVANFLRAQIYAAFATLELGMEILRADGVDIDVLYAHGGLFRTKGVGQRLLSAALHTPVGVAESAAEGGAWGIALLACYLDEENGRDLPEFLENEIFVSVDPEISEPRQVDADGFDRFLKCYREGLELQRAAVTAIPVK